MVLKILLLALLVYSSLSTTVYATIKNEVIVNSNTDGGDTSVKVNISNKVNTEKTSEDSSKSETSVKIHQSGEGTATVKVDGKEYNLEGPGDLNINESSDSTSSDNPALIPTIQPTSSISPTPIPSSLVKGITNTALPQKRTSQWQIIKGLFQSLIFQIANLF